MIINPYMVAPVLGGGAGAHAYWRVLLTANNSGAGTLRFAEIQWVDGSTDVGADHSGVFSSQPSFTDPLDSAAHFDYEAFDGVYDNWWATNEDGLSTAYIGVQLPASRSVTVVYFYARSDASTATVDETSSSWTVQSSDDGATWLDEFSGSIHWVAFDGYSQPISR
jgi:hypothetical protein